MGSNPARSATKYGPDDEFVVLLRTVELRSELRFNVVQSTTKNRTSLWSGYSHSMVYRLSPGVRGKFLALVPVGPAPRMAMQEPAAIPGLIYPVNHAGFWVVGIRVDRPRTPAARFVCNLLMLCCHVFHLALFGYKARNLATISPSSSAIFQNHGKESILCFGSDSRGLIQRGLGSFSSCPGLSPS